MNRRLVIAAILFGFSYSALVYGESKIEFTPDCGAISCYLALGACMEMDEGYSDFLDQVGDVPEEGLNLKQLEGICETWGGHSKAVHCKNLDQLSRYYPDTIPIAHMRKGHYVVLGEISESHVTYYESSGVYTAARVPFESELSGSMLLVSDKPIAFRPRIVGRLVLLSTLGVVLIVVVVFLKVKQR